MLCRRPTMFAGRLTVAMGHRRASLLLRQGTWGSEASLRVAARRRGKYRPPRESHRPDPKGGFCSSPEGLDDYAHPTQETIGEDPPPRRFSEFNNDTLAMMASQGVHGAFKERLLREIMSVDGCNQGATDRGFRGLT